VAGAAAGEFVLHPGPIGTVAFAGFTACCATLNDLDTRGSCAARSLGFLSEGFAWVVEHISGGHRHATHSVLGVAVFTALAWLACIFRHAEHGRMRYALIVFLALAIAAGLRALRLGGHFADLLAIGAAVAVTWTSWHLALIPLAVGLGCAVHILGDMCTVSGCPLAWPFTLRDFGLPRPVAFVTGTWRETWVVSPALLLALGWLAYLAVPH
jgi:membrane-bound metal-dependent hydrolase YbcI (DUF457 family)